MLISLGQSGQSLALRPSLDPGFPGLVRPGWPCGPGFPGFFIPWPAWPKPGLWPGSPRLSGQALTPVFPGLAVFLMQGISEVVVLAGCFSKLCIIMVLNNQDNTLSRLVAHLISMTGLRDFLPICSTHIYNTGSGANL